MIIHHRDTENSENLDTDEHGFAQDDVAGYEMSCTSRACPSISMPPHSANAAALPASLCEVLERFRRLCKLFPPRAECFRTCLRRRAECEAAT